MPGLRWPAAAVTLRLMRLLDRYLLRELLVPFAFCLGGFLLFWVSFDLSTSLTRYQEKRLNATDIVQLYFAKLPEILVLILPIVLLLALLYALTNHARHHELTAIRAAGISLARICVPYFGVGLVLGGISFAMNEYWAPQGAEREEAIMNRHDPKNSAPGGMTNTGYHFVIEGQDWAFQDFDPARQAMISPRVNWTSDKGETYQIVAERAEFTNGVWTFFGVAAETRNGAQLAFEPTVAVPELRETPEQIAREEKFGNKSKNLTYQTVDFSIAQILDYLNLHPRDLAPKIRRGWLTQMHGRIAAPWTCLVVVLIAIPFGAASGRRNLFVGVASSIVICFIYFILMRLGLALGSSGLLPPWLAAWFPNLSFGIAAIGLMLRVR